MKKVLGAKTLQSFQDSFVRAILDQKGEEPSLSLFAETRPVAPQTALTIYRNNVFSSLIEALQDAYPVLYEVMGKDFFRGAAKEFLQTHFPTQRSLVSFGESFGDFLHAMPENHDLPYLADLAKIERAHLLASLAPDAPLLLASALQKVPQTRFAEMAFRMNPSLQRLHLSWPSDKIWEAHQEKDFAPMEVAPQNIFLIIWRKEGVIHMARLQEEAMRFLEKLEAGEVLEEALRGDGFDVQNLMKDFLVKGVFSEVFFPNNSQK